MGLLEQEGEDLGARMHRACETLFQRNYQQVLIVGTDVPSLPLDYYRQALDQLERHDVVVGPAFDGGYYMIGLKKIAPALFQGIPGRLDRALNDT